MKLTRIAIKILLLILLAYGVATTRSLAADDEFSSVEERRLQNSILQERADIRKEREEIALRKKELKSLEESTDKKLAEMDTKLQELRALQKKIESLLEKKSAEEQQRTKELAGIYDKMSPVKAALALSGLDERLATDLLADMKKKAAAKVLDEINKQKATSLSEALATIQLE